MPVSHRLFKSLILSIVIGIGLYAAAIIASDFRSMQAAAVKLGVAGWSVILGLSLFNYGVRFIRWQYYLKRFGCSIPPVRHLVYYLAGFAFATSPGKAGEAIRSFYLKAYSVSYRHSLAAFFVERLIDVVAIVLLALVAAFSFSEARWPVAIAGAIVIFLLPLVHSRLPYRVLDFAGARFSSDKISTFFSHLSNLLDYSTQLLKTTPLYAGLVLGLIAWAAEGYAFFLILKYLDADLPLVMSIGIYSVAILVGALSFIPGGLGSTEAAMVLLLGLSGLDTSTAVIATLICRVATLWFAVLLGLFAVTGLELTGSSLVKANADNPDDERRDQYRDAE